jgi:uncharacterized membrane protein YhiD involved in acid resistance
VAAIGTAAGAGLIVMAVIGTLLILVVLAVLDRIEAFATRRLKLPPEGKTQRPPHQDLDDGPSEDLP